MDDLHRMRMQRTKIVHSFMDPEDEEAFWSRVADTYRSPLSGMHAGAAATTLACPVATAQVGARWW